MDVAVTDPLADGLEFRSVQSDPGVPGTTDSGITCTFPVITPGQTVTMLVRVHVADDFSGSTLTNTASASSPSLPAGPAGPPTTTVTSPVITASDLDVSKTVDHASAGVGDTVTFTVRAVNHGPVDLGPVIVDDRPPAGMTIRSVDQNAGAYSRSTGKWTIATLAAGHTAVLNMTVTLVSSGRLVNVATIDPATPGVAAGSTTRASAAVTIAAANGAGAGKGSLAYTGVAATHYGITAVLMLLAGLVLMVAGRRRRPARHRA